MKKIVLLILFAVVGTLLHAQDSAYVREVVRKLSSPEMFGRGASYKGDSIAADFLAEEMRRLGVIPLGEDYRQYYHYDAYGFEGEMCVEVNGKVLKPYADYRVLPKRRMKSDRAQENVVWEKRVKGEITVLGVKNLSTFSPTSGALGDEPVYVQVREDAVKRTPRKVKVRIPWQFHPGYRSQNVVGWIEGEVDSMVVFVGHYDHCGMMGDSLYFPGAHDNASGVAAVLDIARMAAEKKPHYTYVFMLFSGEESGILGSAYASQNPLIEFDKVKLLLNIDMFCGGDEGIMFFNAQNENTKPVFDKMKAINDEMHAATEIRPRGLSQNSDHYWFSKYCPSIFLCTMGQTYGGYHDPADICESCGLTHYVDFMKLILATVESL